MVGNKNVVVVMPAYNSATTIRGAYDGVMETGIVDHLIVVNDGSTDDTAAIVRPLPGVTVHTHPKNRGYGGTQKTGYQLALERGADIIIMVHSDNQYTPRLVPTMAAMIASGLWECVLGSRILGGHALRQGMPIWKYVSNRVLTRVENVLLGVKLSEYHTGYRAFSRALLERIPMEGNSDDFMFDNEFLAQVHWFGYDIGEVSCPPSYEADASSMSFRRGITYGLGCLATAGTFRLARLGVVSSPRFPR